MTDRSKRLFVYLTIFALGGLVGTAWAAQVNLFPATQVTNTQRARVVIAVVSNHAAADEDISQLTNAQLWARYREILKDYLRGEVRAYYHKLSVQAVAGQLNADFVAEQTPDLNAPEP